MAITTAQRTLRSLADPEIADHSQRFFKTGKGEYGEGDVFLGVRVPVIRKHVKQYESLPLETVAKIIQSKYHEERLFAVLLLVSKYTKAASANRQDENPAKIYRFYIDNLRYVNNWDLVDCSAYKIVGVHLADKDRSLLYSLARSPNLWRRRVAIMSTLHMIKQDDYKDTLRLAKQLLDDTEDLIHKAVGWMLREVGKRDRGVELEFLDRHAGNMPRTMLRYAIEQLPPRMRKQYLARG